MPRNISQPVAINILIYKSNKLIDFAKPFAANFWLYQIFYKKFQEYYKSPFSLWFVYWRVTQHPKPEKQFKIVWSSMTQTQPLCWNAFYNATTSKALMEKFTVPNNKNYKFLSIPCHTPWLFRGPPSNRGAGTNQRVDSQSHLTCSERYYPQQNPHCTR